MSFSTYDFKETLNGVGIDRSEVKKVVAAYGVTEESCCDDCGGEWSGGFLLLLRSGKYVFMTGWCDYTGWGCQDGTERHDYDVKPDLATLDQGYGKKKEWETSLPDLQKFLKDGDWS